MSGPGRFTVDGTLGGKTYGSAAVALSVAITDASHAKVTADFIVRDSDRREVARASRLEDGTVSVHRFDGAMAVA